MSRKKTSLKKIRKLIKGCNEEITSSRELGARAGLSHTKVQAFVKLLNASKDSHEDLLTLDYTALTDIVLPAAKAYKEQQSMEGIKNFTIEDHLGMMLDREVVARSNRRLV